MGQYASSESDLPARLSESRQSCSLYPLHEPGQMTAQRTQRLRARIASVIMSIPATCEDVVDMDENEPCKAVEEPPVAQASKLRRVSGLRDLRLAFRDADHGPAHFPSISSLGLSKVCIEFPGHLAGFNGFSRLHTSSASLPPPPHCHPTCPLVLHFVL